jgi:ABC-type dipeptide/oligopeptide/nickel transport system ATPase component
VLQLKQLRVAYPGAGQPTLDGLDLTLHRGERLALVGPSGCGKSTVARAVLQLLPAGSSCSGGLALAGQDPRRLSRGALRRLRGEAVGLVFQDPMTRLNPLLTIGEHLRDTLAAHHVGEGEGEGEGSRQRQRARLLLAPLSLDARRTDSDSPWVLDAVADPRADRALERLDLEMAMASLETSGIDLNPLYRVVVNGERSALSLGRVEGRATFVMPRAGTLYHSHARVIAYQDRDMVDAWWVTNPRKRSAFR